MRQFSQHRQSHNTQKTIIDAFWQWILTWMLCVCVCRELWCLAARLESYIFGRRSLLCAHECPASNLRSQCTSLPASACYCFCSILFVRFTLHYLYHSRHKMHGCITATTAFVGLCTTECLPAEMCALAVICTNHATPTQNHIQCLTTTTEKT